MKWSEELKGKTAQQAWKLIYDLTKPLTIEQRNKLWEHWESLREQEIKERKQILDKLF